mmetsp:Transcript_37059/g.85588  ORF Transcript_37059/g.85588 Transcript_37059/m.85588 type:complete len:460 (-) Transcript_37059:116-1495(-)
MASELVSALFKRRSDVESKGEMWESQPKPSVADVANGEHLEGAAFDAPSPQEWVQKLDESPEEDLVLEAVVEGLAKRGPRPAHAPASVTDADVARIQGLAEAISKVRNELSTERDKLGGAREDLVRREAELKAREEALEAERKEQRLREEAVQNYPQPSWLNQVEGTINVGVTGNAGVGKSLLINKLRRLRPGAAGWAPVGVKETTMTPNMYEYPGETRARLWDLPGAGTPSFPRESYIRNMGLRYFDKVIVVSAGRFTETDLALIKELEEQKIPFFVVRTKVDIDIINNKEDNDLEEAVTMEQIGRDLREKNGIANPYLVSLRDHRIYDFPRLLKDVFDGEQLKLDPNATTFVPSAKDVQWEEPWQLPCVYSVPLAGLQGRWRDEYLSQYLIQGNQVHVVYNGNYCILPLRESRDSVLWHDGRWRVDAHCINQARKTMTLTWKPIAPQKHPLVWFWCD